jgi:hypothetical protein
MHKDAVAQWKSLWLVIWRSEVVLPVHKFFSKTPPENSGGAENSTETSGTNGINFFCYMYESSLRHPVWVPEINVKPCNSVQSEPYIINKSERKTNEIKSSNMMLDLQSLFGLLCTAVLIGPQPPHLGSYTMALLVCQDRRHLFVTPCIGLSNIWFWRILPMIRSCNSNPGKKLTFMWRWHGRGRWCAACI